MSYKIIVKCKATANAQGSEVRDYEVGETLNVSEPWQQNLADLLVSAGFAEKTKVTAPKETKVVEATETKKRKSK